MIAFSIWFVTRMWYEVVIVASGVWFGYRLRGDRRPETVTMSVPETTDAAATCTVASTRLSKAETLETDVRNMLQTLTLLELNGISGKVSTKSSHGSKADAIDKICIAITYERPHQITMKQL